MTNKAINKDYLIYYVDYEGNTYDSKWDFDNQGHYLVHSFKTRAASIKHYLNH